MLPRTERETSAHYVWVKRGTTLGELVRIYCREGSLRERRDMMEAVQETAHPAKVTIACGEEHSPASVKERDAMVK